MTSGADGSIGTSMPRLEDGPLLRRRHAAYFGNVASSRQPGRLAEWLEATLGPRLTAFAVASSQADLGRIAHGDEEPEGDAEERLRNLYAVASLLAARDAAPVRDSIAPSLEGLWWCNEAVFEASVRVCAPVLGRPETRIRRWSGRAATAIDPIDWPQPSWSALVPSDVPAVTMAHGTGTLAAIATATAGFRDEYYGLQPHVVDDPDGGLPLLITSGLVDVGRVLWGERATRFGGRKFVHPRVEATGLTGALERWVRQRLVPKRLDDHERNQFFRELQWTVIVRASGHQDVLAVSLVRGNHQKISTGFTR